MNGTGRHSSFRVSFGVNNPPISIPLFIDEIKFLTQIHSKLAVDMIKLRELLKQFNSVEKVAKQLLNVSNTLREYPEMLNTVKV